MRRSWVLPSVVAAVLLGLLAAGRLPPIAAEDATPAAGGPDLGGSWRVVVSPANGPTQLTLATFSADGTATTSTLPAQPSPPGAPAGLVFFSTGHGTWEATGPDTANVTFVHLRASAEGQPLGTLTVHRDITLGADGRTFDGEFVSTLADPAGNTLATFSGTVQATRIVAEAPGTPTAGTPAP